jgi:hypothetical protein
MSRKDYLNDLCAPRVDALRAKTCGKTRIERPEECNVASREAWCTAYRHCTHLPQVTSVSDDSTFRNSQKWRRAP